MTDIFAYTNLNIKSALRKITTSGKKCLILIDKKKKILGTLSDGDIRRAILKGSDLNLSIKSIYKKNPFICYEKNLNYNILKKIFLKKKLDLIPIVNKNKEVVKVIYLEDVFKNLNKNKKKLNKKNKIKKDIATVIIAGGVGSRLEPFTQVLPKALLPVHNKPVINHIINKFLNFNYRKFFIIINYKAKILKAYFNENTNDFSLKFLQEDKPLGTASSLGLLKNKVTRSFFLSNCDIILDINYNDLYNFHEQNSFKLTIVVSTTQITIPYGSCKLNRDGSLKKLFEKPEYSFLANVGLYVIHPKILKYIPKHKKFDITDLLVLLKRKKIKVGVFPSDEESWSDVGEWDKYKKTLDNIDRK